MSGLSPQILAAMVHRNRTDPVRPERRVRVRAWPYGRNSVVCGQKLKLNDEGFCEIVVYESDLANVQRNTEDRPEMIQAAVEAHEREVAEWEESLRTKGQNPADVPPINSSVEAHTMRLLGRTRRKLRQFEVVEELPPPEEPQVEGQRETAALIGKAVAEALAPSLQALASAVATIGNQAPRRGRPPKED